MLFEQLFSKFSCWPSDGATGFTIFKLYLSGVEQEDKEMDEADEAAADVQADVDVDLCFC